MGIWADIGAWLTKVGNDVVTFIIDGVGWIKKQLASLRADLIALLQASMGHPLIMLGIISGFVLVQMVLASVYDAFVKLAWVVKLTAFLKSVGDIVKGLAQWMQLNTMITLMQLGMILSDGFYKQITRIYMALGDLSAELDLDFGFITTFVEVDRSIIHAMYAIAGGSALEAEAKYAEGLSTFLQGINTNLHRYAEDPSQIFLDVQKAIILNELGVAGEATGRIWAAIDMSADWIRDKGNVLIRMIDEIEAQVDGMPEEWKTAIDAWYAPIRKKLDTWTSDVWDPFWRKYTATEDVIDAHFLRHDLDIDQLQREVRNPIELLRTALALPKKEREEKLASLDNLVAMASVAEALPVIESLEALAAPMIADGIDLLDNPPLPEPSAEAAAPEFFELPSGPTAIEGPALMETGEDPYSPGGQKADGRSWYVG